MRKVLYVLFSLISLYPAFSQRQIGLAMPDKKHKISIPFELLNNLIIIPVTINNRITLKFILDSGANNLILTERLFGDVMGLQYDRTIMISGPGIIDSVSAHVSNDVTISFPENIVGRHMSILVLEEDYIKLKQNLGEDIFGIIGYDVFSRFVVEIDYDAREINLYNPYKYKPPRRYKKIPIELENTKPYLTGIVGQNGNLDTVKLMIDTGASHALLLDINESKVLVRPDSTLYTTLGHGLGGEIPGAIGRLSSLRLGDFELEDILVSIPEPGAYSNSIKRGSRHGTIGGNTLNRFNPILDYHGRYIYLRKSSHYKERFKHDMSGMHVSYFEDPQRMEVTSITPKGPAEQAGVKEGDIIRSVNGKNIYNSRLSEIYSLLKARERKKIRLVIIRGMQTIRINFRLENMI